VIDTLSKIFLNLEKNHQREDLMMAKKNGQYQPLSTAEFARRVRNISSGLKALGLNKGDKVVILSENRPEWVMVDVATVCSRGVAVPVYTNLTSDQIRYIINDSQARFLVCSNLKLWQKVDSIRPELPLIEKYILT